MIGTSNRPILGLYLVKLGYKKWSIGSFYSINYGTNLFNQSKSSKWIQFNQINLFM